MIRRGDQFRANVTPWGTEAFLVDMPCCKNLKNGKQRRAKTTRYALEKHGKDSLKCPECGWWWTLVRNTGSPFVTDCTLIA